MSGCLFVPGMAGEGWYVEGIEFSDTAAQAARQAGYHVHSGSLENAPTPAYTFDLIVGWMVLEHLHDPVVSLKKMHQWAEPGAWLVLSVPNAGALEFQVFKDKWYALHLPNHLYHFTSETIGDVLKAAGWTMTKIHHQRNINNLFMSIAYSIEEKGMCSTGQFFRRLAGLSGLCCYTLFPLAWLFAIFKQSGLMTIWARKINQ
ncbi:MAG: class I SAM-dependent methyltransferase [Candidatus Electrothrix sp. AR4]|nr:class I SAM-dependent methyltransferase [Candidatus Electrothrix sp. AR4]